MSPARSASPTFATAALDASLLSITETSTPKTIPPSSSLVFGQTFSDHMLCCKWSLTKGWEAPEIKPYGPFSMDPSSSVLHYSTTLFEGLKAYKDVNGRGRLFRPDMNLARLNRGAARLGFPSVDSDTFITLLKQLVSLDEHWIPTEPGTSLYIRPTMIGTRASLGVGPSDEVLLFVIMSPVGAYYSGGAKSISLLASTRDVRAWPGGTGGHKFGSNYTSSIVPAMNAAKEGYNQVLWLLGPHRELTECGMMNLFICFRNADGSHELVTPPLADLILPGVTRDSILALAHAHANAGNLTRFAGLPSRLTVTERPVFMDEIVARSASGELIEAFGSGTAAVVSGISKIGYEGDDIPVPCGSGAMGNIASAMLRELTGRQLGLIESEWSVLV